MDVDRVQWVDCGFMLVCVIAAVGDVSLLADDGRLDEGVPCARVDVAGFGMLYASETLRRIPRAVFRRLAALEI